MGGLAASNYTIIPQMVCCFLAFPLVAIWGMGAFGGFQAVKALEDLPTTYFTLLGPSLKMVMTWVVQWMWVNEWGSQWYFQRTAAARSVKHAKWAFYNSRGPHYHGTYTWDRDWHDCAGSVSGSFKQ